MVAEWGTENNKRVGETIASLCKHSLRLREILAVGAITSSVEKLTLHCDNSGI